MSVQKKPVKRIGDELIEKGIISQDQLRIGLEEQKRTGGQVGKILVELGFLTESVLSEVLGETLQQNSISLQDFIPDPEALSFIQKNEAKKFGTLPCTYNAEQKILRIAISDTFDIIRLDRIKSLLPNDISLESLLAGEMEIQGAIDRFYGHELSIDGILRELETGVFETQKLGVEANEFSHPLVRLVDAFIIDAVKQNASDIHFEPEEGYLRIRYRIDGVLRQIRSLHKKYWPAIAVRLKVMAKLNIAESRAPQDGHMSLKITGHPIDFRISVQPTLHGENIVLRILDRNKGIVPLDRLEITEDNRTLLKLMMARPEGIILVTGPTGSGKTTTLYSLLNDLNNETVNIMTLEDPVEYPINMIRQTSINASIKMDFANGIRSLMRQDPDIILVGEMRDQETAEMGFRAAMTGHQVYSTLHTNSALGSFPRLIDLGIPPEIISGNIIGIVAQRLVRRLCRYCREQNPPNDIEQLLLGNRVTPDTLIYKSKGCPSCGHSGFSGRIAIMEIVKMDGDLDELIVRRATLREIEKLARDKGLQSLAEDGIHHVLAGDTTLDELSRVVDLTQTLSLAEA